MQLHIRNQRKTEFHCLERRKFHRSLLIVPLFPFLVNYDSIKHILNQMLMFG